MEVGKFEYEVQKKDGVDHYVVQSSPMEVGGLQGLGDASYFPLGSVCLWVMALCRRTNLDAGEGDNEG
jgi:hypothetical protein